MLNNIVQNFGMLDLVKKVLASHKSQMDRYREQYTRSLAGQCTAPTLVLQLAHQLELLPKEQSEMSRCYGQMVQETNPQMRIGG